MMGNIIDFIAAKAKKADREPRDLDELIAEAFAVSRDRLEQERQKDEVLASKDLRTDIKAVIMDTLIKQRLISSEYFLCGLYISKMMSEYALSSQESWYAFDHIKEGEESGDYKAFQKGGDICFLICSIFTGRARWRLMQKEYYLKLGAGLYLSFYYRTNREIGYFMSKNFSAMAEITHNSFLQP